MEEDVKKTNIFKKGAVPLMLVAVMLVVAFSVQGANNRDAFRTDGSVFDLVATENFDLDELFYHDLPVILTFGAAWCNPCQELKAALERVNEDIRGRAIMKYLDVEEFYDLVSEFPIHVVPTIFFYNGDGSPFSPENDFPIVFQNYSLRSTGEHALTAHEGYLSAETILLILESMGIDL